MFQRTERQGYPSSVTIVQRHKMFRKDPSLGHVLALLLPQREVLHGAGQWALFLCLALCPQWCFMGGWVSLYLRHMAALWDVGTETKTRHQRFPQTFLCTSCHTVLYFSLVCSVVAKFSSVGRRTEPSLYLFLVTLPCLRAGHDNHCCTFSILLWSCFVFQKRISFWIHRWILIRLWESVVRYFNWIFMLPSCLVVTRWDILTMKQPVRSSAGRG